MYLRWFKLNLEYCNHPYAYFTIGSCIGVRSSAYQKQGGMNKRKAGEDFYFLQKIFPLENFKEINSTTVYPSARLSDRVPFGTGAFLNQHKEGNVLEYKSFNPSLFEELKSFIDLLNDIFESEKLVQSNKYPTLLKFLETINFHNHLKEIKANSKGYAAFRKRFFRWFNGLMVLQFLHFGQKEGVSDVSLIESCYYFLQQIDFKYNTRKKNLLNLLKTYQKINRLNKCEKSVFFHS